MARGFAFALVLSLRLFFFFTVRDGASGFGFPRPPTRPIARGVVFFPDRSSTGASCPSRFRLSSLLRVCACACVDYGRVLYAKCCATFYLFRCCSRFFVLGRTPEREAKYIAYLPARIYLSVHTIECAIPSSLLSLPLAWYS